MMNELRNATPFISFGLGHVTAQATAGQPVTVWLATLYNLNTYDFTLTSAGTVTQISAYEYTVTFNDTGTYEISLTVNSRTKGISLQSNSLTLTVT